RASNPGTTRKADSVMRVMMHLQRRERRAENREQSNVRRAKPQAAEKSSLAATRSLRSGARGWPRAPLRRLRVAAKRCPFSLVALAGSADADDAGPRLRHVEEQRRLRAGGGDVGGQ